ncbi:uncharacterized protein LOC101459643 [Ceratitis capitata]|uniref:uncharacterized protein LOC101459643 n=1 Tax=Ceratitis capitata TaxID=7213 RepID=UPI00032A29EA|nr:uncharacterized protein LOC101459643 [Ceratitis capitata]
MFTAPQVITGTFLLATLLVLAPYAHTWDRAYVRKYLLAMMPYIQPQEMAWFVSEQCNTEQISDVTEFMRTLNGELGLTQTVLTNRTDIHFIETTMKTHIVSVVFTTGPSDPIMNVQAHSLRDRHLTFNLIIMLNVVSDFDVIRQFLYELALRGFHKPLLYYVSADNGNEVYGYTIFPVFTILNRVNYSAELEAEFTQYIAGGLNVRGYKLRTPLRQDLPGVFRARDTCNDTKCMQGTTFNLLSLYIDYINATLVSYPMPQDRLGGNVIDMKAAFDLLRRKEISFLAHAYALFYDDESISLSYPVGVVRWCLMVPIWNSVSTMFYLLEPFDRMTWFGIIFVFGALLLQQWLWCCLQGTNELVMRLSDSVLRSLCLCTGINIPHSFSAPSALEFLIFTTFFFYGFFLTANYTSLLGSILAVTSFRAQFNTMDDLVAANLSVLIIDYELEFLHASDIVLPANFSRLIQPVDAATFIALQYSFNTNYAYFVTEDKWHFLDLQQQYLKQGIYKFSKICFGSFFVAFPMRRDSFFYRSLEYYIFRMHSSGLLAHYERTAFDYAVQAGLVKRLTYNSEYTSAGMQHLMVVFFMLIAMHMLSLLVFLSELLYHRAAGMRRGRVSEQRTGSDERSTSVKKTVSQ